MRLVFYSSLVSAATAFVNIPTFERNAFTSLSMIDLQSDVATTESGTNSIFLNKQNARAATTNEFRTSPSFHLMDGVRDFLIAPANAADSSPKPPTNDEIKLLRTAFGALYGERNPEKAEELITKAIAAWERQNPDERAALYRVRGDCYMVRNAMMFPDDFECIKIYVH
jgi:hypothetical protein